MAFRKASRILVDGRPVAPDSTVSPPAAPAHGQNVGKVPPASAGSARSATAVDASRIVTIGPGTAIKGEIWDCATCEVHGYFEGTLASAEINLHESGEIRGSAIARNAVIQGRLTGDLVVRDFVDIKSTGAVDGKLVYSSLALETGGSINGTLQLQDPKSFDASYEGLADGASASTIGQTDDLESRQ